MDEVTARAGYSKGAFYWQFSSKDDLFLALLDERIDQPWHETIALMLTEEPAAGRRFAELLRKQREILLLEQEYRLQAARDGELRARYVERQAKLRARLGEAIAARLEHLGAPPLPVPLEQMAAAVMALASGLAQEKLLDPEALGDGLLGEILALIFAGHLARSV